MAKFLWKTKELIEKEKLNITDRYDILINLLEEKKIITTAEKEKIKK
jgi:hypothetical protein